MDLPQTHSNYFICHVCSHLINVPADYNKTIVCDRCGFKNHRLEPKSQHYTFIFTLTALIFYIPANIFPFMTMELYGNRSSSTIWGGIVSLSESGSWGIAIVVFLASMLIPFVKLIVLLYLSMTASSKKRPYLKTKLYQVIEAIGRWSMLDIFLLAVLVAMMKFGHFAHVEPEPGAILFALVVIFTMSASAFFDPKLLWSDKNENAT